MLSSLYYKEGYRSYLQGGQVPTPSLVGHNMHSINTDVLVGGESHKIELPSSFTAKQVMPSKSNEEIAFQLV